MKIIIDPCSVPWTWEGDWRFFFSIIGCEPLEWICRGNAFVNSHFLNWIRTNPTDNFIFSVFLICFNRLSLCQTASKEILYLLVHWSTNSRASRNFGLTLALSSAVVIAIKIEEDTDLIKEKSKENTLRKMRFLCFVWRRLGSAAARGQPCTLCAFLDGGNAVG